MSTLGTLFIISAPSGAGKTSLVKRLVETTPDTAVSVSHTTRPPRPGERQGSHYHFVAMERFQALVSSGAFLEYAPVFDHFYGTSREAILQPLKAGVDIILEIDWQGARQVRERMPDSRGIFILPPSRQALRQRLYGRGQDTDTVIERRMQDAIGEISHHAEFDYIVINDDFEEALNNLRAIFIAHRQRRANQLLRHQALIHNLMGQENIITSR